MDSDLDGFEHIWTSERENYRLVRMKGSNSEYMVCAIYYLPSGTVLTVEDEDIGIKLVERLLAEGIEIVDGFPKPLSRLTKDIDQ